MNRQIIFRAKTFNEGEWVQGVPIDTHIGTFIVTEENLHICSEYNYMEIDAFLKVNPDTLGQYTGVDDINGKRIFGGDIVRIHKDIGFDNVGVVVFKDGCFWIEYAPYTTKFFHPLSKTKDEWKEMNATIPIRITFEVLGNIFDNPEFLDKKTSK